MGLGGGTGMIMKCNIIMSLDKLNFRKKKKKENLGIVKICKAQTSILKALCFFNTTIKICLSCIFLFCFVYLTNNGLPENENIVMLKAGRKQTEMLLKKRFWEMF